MSTSLQSPLYKSSLKKRDMYDYQSAEKRKNGSDKKKDNGTIGLEMEDEAMTGSNCLLPQPMQ